MIPEKGKVLVDFHADWCGVRSIPCFIVIQDGLEIQRKIGMQSLDQLKDLVK